VPHAITACVPPAVRSQPPSQTAPAVLDSRSLRRAADYARPVVLLLLLDRTTRPCCLLLSLAFVEPALTLCGLCLGPDCFDWLVACYLTPPLKTSCCLSEHGSFLVGASAVVGLSTLYKDVCTT
jgi:hypothetical protein